MKMMMIFLIWKPVLLRKTRKKAFINNEWHRQAGIVQIFHGTIFHEYNKVDLFSLDREQQLGQAGSLEVPCHEKPTIIFIAQFYASVLLWWSEWEWPICSSIWMLSHQKVYYFISEGLGLVGMILLEKVYFFSKSCLGHGVFFPTIERWLRQFPFPVAEQQIRGVH